MRIECQHGYFKFYETYPGEAAEFADLFSLDLSPAGEYFTFTNLLDAPNYSLVGGDFLEIPTTVLFEGEPWDVMRENGLVFNFELAAVVPIISVARLVEIVQASSYFLADGLILPGSVTDDGSRVTDFSAWFSKETMKFKYSAVSYE